MVLSARMLKDVANVNTFSPTNQAKFTVGDQVTLYFQLIDSALDTPQQGFSPAGRRYVPAVGATLQVIVDNIDDAKAVERYATQPYPQDPSIWALTLLPTDPIPAGTASLKLYLTEGPKATRGVALAALGIMGA